MKKLVILLGLALALSLVFATGAYANFGPHGGYALDTDSCAACHRAHSSFSTIQFTPKDPGATLPADYPYALLVGNASTMTEFCYACHGDAAVGASTNVELGIFDSGPSGAAGMAVGDTYADGTVVQYLTNSVFNAGLNGGGFTQSRNFETNAMAPNTSSHILSDAADLPLWGSGQAVTAFSLSCADCHDPHGSTNYRLLKDTVNTVNVALNVFGDDDPANYPYADGWKRGADGGAMQMANYVPDYTGGTKLVNNAGAQNGSLSEWCAACHTDYVQTTSAMSYTWAGTVEGPYTDPADTEANPATRHRHPMNVAPVSGDAVLQVNALSLPQSVAGTGSPIPLERTIGTSDTREWTLGCLTCHYAHGSSEAMTGWASAALTIGDGTNGVASGFIMPVRDDALGGVDPTFDSSLLRAKNRTVCEACHQK